MAYSTGSASSMADLQTALTNAGTANGWTWAGSILSSGDCFVRLTSAAGNIEALVGLGKSGTTITTPAPAVTYLSAIHSSAPIAFPLTYHIFAKSTEIYLIANYSTSLYTYLAFGQSPIVGMPGKGVWVAGTAHVATGTDAGGSSIFSFGQDGTIAGDYFSEGNNSGRTGLFLVSSGLNATSAGCYVHHGLVGWSGIGAAMPKTLGGIKQLNGLDNPSTNWNAQTVLVPIQPWIDRGSSKVSIVADLLYARYVRIDNLEPGDTITLGSDQWRVFPVYKKNASVRDGDNNAHSGTYGYAFKV